jgi:hypothetical protein
MLLITKDGKNKEKSEGYFFQKVGLLTLKKKGTKKLITECLFFQSKIF